MQQKWNEGLCNKYASKNGKFFVILRLVQLGKQGMGNGKWKVKVLHGQKRDDLGLVAIWSTNLGWLTTYSDLDHELMSTIID